MQLFRFILFCAIVCMASTIDAQKTTWKHLDSVAHNMQTLTYKTTDDTTLNIYYIKPNSAKKNSRLPAVIWIHGGAWVGGKANTFFTNAAYCSMNNAVGISIEYTLINKLHKDITNCIEDCSTAIAFIKEKAVMLNIDTNKLVLVGESAGGHLAIMTALNSKHQFKAMVLYNPVVNCATGTFIKFMHASTILNKQLAADTTNLLNKYREKAMSVSPLFILNQGLPPTLIIQGKNDIITPYEFAVNFFSKAKELGTKGSIVLLNNTQHSFAIPHYKANGQQVVDALLLAHDFLIEQKILKRKLVITSSNDINWLRK